MPFGSTLDGPVTACGTARQRHMLKTTHLLLCRRSKWLVVDTAGLKSVIQADKRTLISQYGLTIPIRDMRWLDPNLTSAQRGNIAVRDAAIVFSIE